MPNIAGLLHEMLRFSKRSISAFLKSFVEMNLSLKMVYLVDTARTRASESRNSRFHGNDRPYHAQNSLLLW